MPTACAAMLTEELFIKSDLLGCYVLNYVCCTGDDAKQRFEAGQHAAE